MSRTVALHYLGPEGTFTHQAAIAACESLRPLSDAGTEFELVAEPDAASIVRAVRCGEGYGVIAWENNVEGYVVPNLDMLLDAEDVAGFARVGVDVAFDAFVRPGTDVSAVREVSAHPHGLAQCRRFIAEHGLTPVPVSSNAAACRDLEVGRMAFGPAICGRLYWLDTVASGVQDYQGARTEFLVLGTRDDAAAMLDGARGNGVTEFESIITFIPLVTGPGVLANLLDVLRDAGLNMTSFISRPIKGQDATYSFITTLDAAPWQENFREALTEVAEHGDWIKTLAVYPRRERPNPPVDAWMLPEGGVHLDAGARGGAPGEGWRDDERVRKELLW
ncbi:chorismate mutase [Bifidobacterium sp. DSM 109958]|uniref:Prephenate dehydratase n=1 Tax=Bifidobacterium moraviense TaxID=2675323 RepID=A0A7Y0HZP3_9BIFI|nr:prephenate dehydratase domain-containing protein [Bifidobacterium sp. DSM 109958]NMN00415.1 chorismate mutase [Bifidobacterium sp. DSM 109958]